jgi:tetratricopeptide (TPR) repeat protein
MPGQNWTMLAAVLLIAGCGAANKSDPRADGSGKINASDVRFETSEDPPLQAKTHFAAGQLAEARGDYPVAVEQYWKAIKLQPKCKEALYRLGIVYCHLEHYPDAVVAWKEYLKATDGEATGYSNLAFCYELANKHSEAEAAYRKGIDKDPNNNPCRVNYGLMLARDNRIGEATIQLQAVLTPAEVHYNLASVFEQQGHPERAKSEYRKALAADPALSDAAVRLSVLK